LKSQNHYSKPAQEPSLSLLSQITYISGPHLAQMWPMGTLLLPEVIQMCHSWLRWGQLWDMSAIVSHTQVESSLSFHVVCGPEECGRCGPQLGQMSFAVWDLAYKYLCSI